MNRRRFVVTAIAAGAVGVALATDACSNSVTEYNGPQSVLPPAGPVTELNVAYAVTEIKGYKLRGRVYNGRTYGPTVQTRPGETLAFRIVNRLPPNAGGAAPIGSVEIPAPRTSMEAMNAKYKGPLKRSTTIDKMNNPHGFNTTNLHVHGIQTVPHLFNPIGTSDPSAPMVMIEPGKSFSYNLPVPANHPSGLHWYHPHKHGSTDVQVSNGMAGLIVIRGPIDEVPEIAAAREIFMTVQTLDVNPSTQYPGEYDREYKAYKTPQEGGYSFGTQYTMLTVNGEGTYWIDNNDKSPAGWSALGVPQFSVQPGEVVRLRLLNGTNYLALMMVLAGFDVWQIGFDGVNTLEPIYLDMTGKGVTTITPENLFSAPIRLTAPANRIELLIRAPKTPGTYKLSSLASNGIDFEPRPAFDIADFVVAGSPVTMGIPKKLPVPTREYPVITKADIVRYRTFVFNQGPRTDLLTGFGFTVNDQLYQEMDSSVRPKVGTCEEWRLENASNEAHPFHLHVNSFQLIALNDVPNDPMEVWDTFYVPPKVGGTNGSLTIRIRFVEWVGKTVFHCHILPHEDTGMMHNFTIE